MNEDCPPTIDDLLVAYASCDRAAKVGARNTDVFVQLYLQPDGGGYLLLMRNLPLVKFRRWEWTAGDDLLAVLLAIKEELETLDWTNLEARR